VTAPEADRDVESAGSHNSPGTGALADLAVIVPARNAEALLEGCLASVVASRPGDLILVDGNSTDRTVEIASQYGARILSDKGAGLPAARLLGAESTDRRWIALIDADVVLPEGALEALLGEFRDGGYTALQAGLESTSGPGYWGRALAMHHRTGRSKNWFGLVATIFDRDKLMTYGFDEVFSSGEDIDMRWRLQQADERIGVSQEVVVEHRFGGDDFAFARDQWRMDGYGLGQMVRRHGVRGLLLAGLPAAAAVRGIGLSLGRLQPQWIPYYLAFAFFNYLSMARAFLPQTGGRRGRLLGNAAGLLAGKGAAMAVGFTFWVLAIRSTSAQEVGLAAAAFAAMMLCTQLSILGIGAAFITVAQTRERPQRVLLDGALTIVTTVAVVVGLTALGVLSTLPAFSTILSPVFVPMFVLQVVLGTIVILLDHVAMAVGRGRDVAKRGLAGGLLTIAPFAIPGLMRDASATSLFSLWLLGAVVSCSWGWILVRRSTPGYVPRLRIDTALTHQLLRAGLPNWGLTLTERVPGLVLPILVAELLSTSDNARWYIVWMMAWVIYQIPNSVGIALFAEVSSQPGRVAAISRRALRVTLLLGVSGATLLAVLATPVLSILGPDYASAGSDPLRILLLGVVPMAYLQVRYAVARAGSNIGPALLLGLTTAAVGLLAAGFIGVRGGLAGVAATWVVTLAVAAIAIHLMLEMPAPAATDTASAQAPQGATRPRLPLPRGFRPSERSGADGSPPPAQASVSAYAWVSLIILALAAGLWVWGSTLIDLADMTDLGLASVLPLRMWIALGLLAVALVVALVDGRTPGWILALHVIVLGVLVFGLSSWLYDAPRGAVNFRHAGVTSVLMDTGIIDREIDAYFNWPGFFAGAATIAKAAGLSTPLSLARWAPLAVNLLALAPVWLLLRSLTTDTRRIWLAMWLFGALNWISQDYFAPQAFGYLLYLTLIAILVHLFRAPSSRQSSAEPRHQLTKSAGGRVRRWWQLTTDLPDQAPRDSGRMAAIGVVLVLCAAIVACHQLTPFAALTVVTALVLVNRCRLRLLPVILLTMIVAWDGYVALPFISGHAGEIFGGIGDLGNVASANIANRVTGTAEHLIVVRVRLGLTFAVWALAALGAYLRHRRGETSRTLLAISAAPLLLLPIQPYGGEMLLRVYWFVLPGVALLAASVFLPGRRGDAPPVPAASGGRSGVRRAGSALAWTGTALALVGLLSSNFIARHGNERMDYYPPAEVAGVKAMYALAPPGADIIAGAGSFPWRDQGYAEHRAVLLERIWVPGDQPRTAVVVAQLMKAAPAGAVLVITSSQEEATDMLGIFPAGSLRTFANYVDASRAFGRVYADSDVRVWQACGAEGSTC